MITAEQAKQIAQKAAADKDLVVGTKFKIIEASLMGLKFLIVRYSHKDRNPQEFEKLKASLVEHGYKLEQRETRLADILLISWD